MLVNRNKKAGKTNPVYNDRLEIAKNITRLATGSDTCLEAPIRIARRFTGLSQTSKTLVTLQSQKIIVVGIRELLGQSTQIYGVPR